MMQIDRGIPAPVDTSRDGIFWRKYPLPDLQVGDSLFALGVAGQRLKMAAKNYKFKMQGTGWRYRSRMENGGTRVWRIS